MWQKANRGKIGLVLFFFAYSFFVVLQSPMNPWSNAYPSIDSSVFIYLGRTILNGGTPYVDAFDHKGPVLYFINAAGLMIHSEYGIWLLEIAFLTATFFAAYKICCRITKTPVAALFSVVVVFSLLGQFLEGGNFTEEYAMLFQMVAFCLFCEYYLSGKLVGWHIGCVGICFAMTALIRLNLVAGWIPCCIYIFGKLISKKDIAGIRKCLTCFLMGVLLVCIPVFLYLVLRGAFPLFWHDYIVFNIRYATRNDMEAVVSAIRFFGENGIVRVSLLAGIVMILHAGIRRKHLSGIFVIAILNFLCWLLSFWVIVSPGNQYRHYMMSLLPYMVIPLAYNFDVLYRNRKKIVFSGLLAVLVLALAWQGVWPMWSNILQKFQAKRKENEDSLVAHLNGIMKEGEELLVIGGINCWIYNETGSFASSRYSYSAALQTEEMKAEYIEDLQNNPPEYIVTCLPPDSIFQTVSEEYRQIYETEQFLLFEKRNK